MEQFICDERNGLWCERHVDYYLPCLEAPKSPKVGKFVRLRNAYLREHQGAIYTGMLYSGKLNARANTVGFIDTVQLKKELAELRKAREVIIEVYTK